MRISNHDVPQEVIDGYKLYGLNLVHNGFVFVEIWKFPFGLKQSDALANKQPSKVFGREGYFQSEHTSDLLLHKTWDISFTLMVDDFGVKYMEKKMSYMYNPSLKSIPHYNWLDREPIY